MNCVIACCLCTTTALKYILHTSSLSGLRPVTPRACGARKKAPGRAVYDKFIVECSIALATRHGPRPCVASGRVVRYVARAASAVAPVPFINHMTLSKSAILHRFPNFYILGGPHFPKFLFPFKSACDPYEPWKVSWKSVRKFFRNRKHRHTDTQTNAAAWIDRRGNFI